MILIWDTCAINAISRGCAFKINNTPANGAAMTRSAEFLASFELVFREITECLGHSNATSDITFNIEIDPRLPGSMLREPTSLAELYCRDPGFPADWHNMLDTSLMSEAVENEAIRDIGPILQNPLGPCDESLIVAAIRLGNQRHELAAVVTDDTALYDEILALRSQHQSVNIVGEILSTQYLSTFLSLEILRYLYLECEITDDAWRSLVESFKHHQNGRNDAAAKEHNLYVVELFSRIDQDKQDKAVRAMNRDLAHEFGVDDA